jgi:3-deoxy-manno-octulosonate cytidylyltransferase (CMP-KDO synthetase)
MSVFAIIPARYASTRFPGKPLADICGKPMIQHVYERTAQADSISQVVVATDDERIREVVLGFGGEVAMTRPDHPSGTDRLAEVAATIEADLIVNVQGDEPLIDPVMIDQAVKPLLANPSVVMGTLKCRIDNDDDFANPNVVKVVVDKDDFALYFSRSPIPCLRDAVMAEVDLFKHVGLYVYRREFLLKYPALPETPLELSEKLEQLRALEHGYRIYVAETDRQSIGVDVPEDLQKVIAEVSK